MSYTTLTQAASDQALQARTVACVQQEARSNPALSKTAYAEKVRTNQASPVGDFQWPVAIATETAYAYAIAQDKPNPGGDPTVISDGDILAAVQANWPPDSPAVP